MPASNFVTEAVTVSIQLLFSIAVKNLVLYSRLIFDSNSNLCFSTPVSVTNYKTFKHYDVEGNPIMYFCVRKS